MPFVKYHAAWPTNAGLAEPRFTFTDFVSVEIHRDGYRSEKAGQVSGQIKVPDNQWDILLLEMSGQVSGQVKKRMVKILNAVYHQRLNANLLAELLHELAGTLRRDINRLRKWNVIEFEGPPKTGGYVLTEDTTGSLFP
jgi:hypothetical protein